MEEKMNDKYLARAQEKFPDPRKLVIAVSRRVKQFARNSSRPMVKIQDDNLLNIALLEAAEGLLSLEKNDEKKE